MKSDINSAESVRRRTPHLLVAAVVFLSSFGVFYGSQSTQAHDSHGWVWIGRDRIYNFDHKSQSQTLANADWPISITFWNNASPDNIKAQRHDIFAYNCNASFGLCKMNHRNDDSGNGTQWANGSEWYWDQDGGRKEFRCGYSGGAGAWAMHYRAYDGPVDSFFPKTLWSPGWGFHVPVSTHYDYDDPDSLPFSPCDNKQHGYNEIAEYNMMYWYDAVPGWGGYNDWMHLHNANAGTRVLNGVPHIGDGDGNMSIMYVPG